MSAEDVVCIYRISSDFVCLSFLILVPFFSHFNFQFFSSFSTVSLSQVSLSLLLSQITTTIISTFNLNFYFHFYHCHIQYNYSFMPTSTLTSHLLSIGQITLRSDSDNLLIYKRKNNDRLSKAYDHDWLIRWLDLELI